MYGRYACSNIRNCGRIVASSRLEKFNMIVREQAGNLILITQPHHASLSGTFADHWKVTAFRGFERLEDVLFTIRSHDQCWEETDKEPLLNTHTGLPYSFEDYPEEFKLTFYARELDRLEQTHPYPAYLCSKHFGSFYTSASDSAGKEFYVSETRRQVRLVQELGIRNEVKDDADFHFHLLQFCDNLSLFLCLNEAGKNEHPWFKRGFANSEKLGVDSKQLKADWQNADSITIRPFPFDEPFFVTLEYREIPADIPDQKTLSGYWQNAPMQTKLIHIR